MAAVYLMVFVSALWMLSSCHADPNSLIHHQASHETQSVKVASPFTSFPKKKEFDEQTEPVKVAGDGQALSFASYYGNHMVLQQAPKAACVWGFADVTLVGLNVTVTLTSSDGKTVEETVSVISARSETTATWFVKVKPVSASGPYSLSAKNGNTVITITDVLFGDVWLCSGQSNMEFTVSQLKPDDLHAELKSAGSYHSVRLFTVMQAVSKKPLLDLPTVQQPWSIASPDAINGGSWRYFSAVCWLYGRRLQETLGYPIGLVASDYGGTPVKSWSGPDAIKVCTPKDAEETRETEEINRTSDAYLRYSSKVDDVENDAKLPWNAVAAWNDSVLWNPMIHPLLNMTIFGAIWYQGEADAGSSIYSCRFPAMIRDWREKFNQGSQGETDIMFPFGFVQLAPWHNDSSLIGGFPSVRWQQTAKVGYVPNDIMPRTFMAVAMDLPDYSSIYSGVHSQYKEQVADRLHLASVAVAYGYSGIKFQGPMPTSYYAISSSAKPALQIEYDNGKTILRVLNDNGFEVCCHNEKSLLCPETSPNWVSVRVIAHDPKSVTITTEACSGKKIKALRYAWRESPCPLNRCAVYSAQNFLPAPPIVVEFASN